MKLKRAFAVFVAAMMCFNCTAFGGRFVTIKPEKGVPVEFGTNAGKSGEVGENGVRVVTYAEAVELAIKNNNDLKTLADQLDTLEEQNEQLWYALQLKALPESIRPVAIPSSTISLFTSLNSIEAGMNTVKYSEQMLKESCELVIKNYMKTIVQAERNVELLTKNLELVTKTTYFNRLKFDMGMISLTELNAAINEQKNMELNLQLLNLSLETAYNNLKRVIGIKDEKFEIDYSVVYEEYPQQTDLNSFAKKKTQNAPTLLMAQKNVDNAQFQMDYIALDNVTSYEERDKNLASASREYEDTKNDLLLAVKNGYIAVKQAEGNIETLKLSLENVKAQYENAKMSYEMGYITEVEFMGAGLAVMAAENDLESAIINHDMAKFMVDHPYLSTSSSAAQK